MLAGLTALIVAVLVVVAGQTQTMPKTSWGEPDLQGIWDAMPRQIPLQRPRAIRRPRIFYGRADRGTGHASVGDSWK